MKKILTIICLAAVLASVLLSGFTVGAALDDDWDLTDTNGAQALIGTWRWTTSRGYVYVFREDGTGLRGPSGMRSNFTWSVDGDELQINHERWSFTVIGDTLTISNLQVRGMNYSYTFYSEDTDLYDSSARTWIVIGVVIAVVVLGLIALAIVLPIVLIRRKKRNQNNLYNR